MGQDGPRPHDADPDDLLDTEKTRRDADDAALAERVEKGQPDEVNPLAPPINNQAGS